MIKQGESDMKSLPLRSDVRNEILDSKVGDFLVRKLQKTWKKCEKGGNQPYIPPFIFCLAKKTIQWVVGACVENCSIGGTCVENCSIGGACVENCSIGGACVENYSIGGACVENYSIGGACVENY